MLAPTAVISTTLITIRYPVSPRIVCLKGTTE